MPQTAWKALIEHLMVKHGEKRKTRLATELGVTAKTVTRWLGEKPSVPETDSIKKVAKWAGISVTELRKMWTRFMMKENGIYEQGGGPENEVKEQAAVYDALYRLDGARDLEKLDLKNVPPEMVPPLIKARAQIMRFAEHWRAELGGRRTELDEMVANYREMYQAAVDLAFKTQLPLGP